ncbi:MAG: prohibitin family protein [Cyclobacteriaceae bacterium]|nr:prohibitin family protein [Cyclobacteriaceae bacterium]
MNNRRFLPLIIITFSVLIVVILLSSSLFFTIKPGERGVIFDRFTGLKRDKIYEPGFHVKAPWNELILYDVTETQIEEPLDVLDKNGLSIKVDISVRFHPVFSRVGYLHEIFRGDYVNRLVIPEVRSTVRKVMGRYTAEEIYSTKRSEVEVSIVNETKDILDENFITMRALLIRSINLPEQIKMAIENKLKQEQEALAYQFRLDREKSEAERMRIQAEGEARANAIINSSLTDELLKMRGIEATIRLAESENAKVIVIGSGEGGLPLILGNN